MSVVAIGSVKGSPGATTMMLALGAVWPSERQLLLIEADPDGGVLAARGELKYEPGLVSLAAASRHGLEPTAISEHTQELAGGLRVLVAPPDPREAERAIVLAADRLSTVLPGSGLNVLVDVGRVRPQSPASPLFTRSEAVLVVTRPRIDELLPVAATAHELRHEGTEVAVILVGDRPHAADEVAAALDVEVIGVLADDARAASALTGAGGRHSSLRRSLLIRSATELVPRITAFADRGRPRPRTSEPASSWASPIAPGAQSAEGRFAP